MKYYGVKVAGREGEILCRSVNVLSYSLRRYGKRVLAVFFYHHAHPQGVTCIRLTREEAKEVAEKMMLA